MNPEKYDREIILLCPTCGNSEMKHSDESSIVKCTNCNREMTKDELIEENGQSIDDHVSEVKKEIINDFEKEVSKIFKNAFKGSKNIRIK
ncbi:TPA: hypothetical protein ACPY8E_003983 [Yersinia enterocolitica]|uniref:ECs_2282 family putative zinc-binding protein n=1 Tax=Yersinia enterocolitica TaxID=630 RepID=UPI0029AB9612|nr:hypothetical protein [Yersinia enterocolitica]EKN5063251.1 hypothetical protein [Yersinia enterocolitica]ELW9026215.1 hypothetical protein [Yersinia enterocolitica]HEN3542016.1 hypothetical protein [Yersinia enterocolitica]